MSIYPPDIITAGVQALFDRLEGVGSLGDDPVLIDELADDVIAVLDAVINSASSKLRQLAFEEMHTARTLGEPVLLRQAQQYGALYDSSEGMYR